MRPDGLYFAWWVVLLCYLFGACVLILAKDPYLVEFCLAWAAIAHLQITKIDRHD